MPPRPVRAYTVLCWLMALLNLGLLVTSVWLIVDSERLTRTWFPDLDLPGWIPGLAGKLLIVPAVAFAALNLWLPRVRRQPGSWTLHFVNILAAVTTCVLAPLALWLAFAWRRPEVRAWYDQSA